MKKFIKNLTLALLPIIVINILCFGTLFYLAATEDLTYVNYAAALDKEQRLNNIGNNRRLVLIGGSNARFGFDSGVLEDSLHIAPVNMGIHIGLGLDFMFDEVDTALHKGDILLVSPEYSHFLENGTYYGDEGLTDMYLVKHKWWKAFRHIADTHNFNSIYRLIRRRIKRIGTSEGNIPDNMEVRTKYNKYGDYIGHYDLPAPDSWDKAPSVGALADDKVFSSIQAHVNSLRDKGVEVMFIPPPYAKSTYDTDSVLIDNIANRLEDIGSPFLFHPSETVYPDSIFYDSRYHLTKEGILIHSNNIAHKLKNSLIQ